MKQCNNCNAPLNDNAVFCTACGANQNVNSQGAGNAAGQQPYQSNPQMINPNNGSFVPNANNQQIHGQQFQPVAPADNRRTYSIMSYIGILWLFGLCSAPEKYDQRVRFNVGQGIMASIVSGALTIIAIILTAIINAVFRTEKLVLGFGTGQYETSPVAGVLNTLIFLAVFGISIFYLVYGIVKVSKNQDAYLPIIGKLAFYK